MSQAYRDFFKDSPAGQEFVTKLHVLIDTQHKKGEDSPEMSRDYTQRAKGIREVIALINVATAKSGKKRERLLEEAARYPDIEL